MSRCGCDSPNMKKYAAVSKALKPYAANNPLVQSISIDEAYLDLSGTNRLHQGVPAFTMARLANDVKKKLGITVSIGLSYNKFLAKLASDMDKPNGFSVIGEQNIKTFLANYPIQAISGVGRRLETNLKMMVFIKFLTSNAALFKNFKSAMAALVSAFLTFLME